MHIEVTGVTLGSNGTGVDVIYIETNLPSGVWPFTHTAVIKMEVAKDHGRKYVETNFPNVPFEDLNISRVK